MNALPKVVQKYGGTSVGSPERILAIAKRIKQQLTEQPMQVAVVVSAMSGETNRLIDLVRATNPNASPKSFDMAVAAGEQASVGLMTAALEAVGLCAEPLLGHQVGIHTDGAHGRARILKIDTTRIVSCWKKKSIPVIAGFQGIFKNRDITTLGRGGSDTSAVAISVALAANYCEINTDVAGVYTSDPRVVPNAALIEKLDYETALELSSLGSKVLHVRCVELAAKYGMRLIVRKSSDPENARRTEIMALSSDQILEAPVVSGITLDRNVARVTVEGFEEKAPILARLFQTLASQNINVDIIVHDRNSAGELQSLGFTITNEDASRADQTIEALKSESCFSNMVIKLETSLSKVSVVGLGMQSNTGVASHVFAALQEANIQVLMVSTSEIKISCVVNQDQAEAASRCLHDTFFSEAP